MALCLDLPDLQATLSLGQVLGSLCSKCPGENILLDGELGAGKTSLVRGLVSALPGGEKAETSSPSFTICNIYSTCPQVAHFDLYRLEGLGPDESIFEWLDSKEACVVVEWARFLDQNELPSNRVCLDLLLLKTGRSVKVTWQGLNAYCEQVLTRDLGGFRPTPCS